MKSATKRLIRDNIDGWTFVLPAFLFMAAFLMYPLLHTLLLSFQKFNFVYDESSLWVGIANYKSVLANPVFRKAIGNTFYFSAIYIPVMFVLGFLIGYHFTRTDLWVSKVSRVVMFIPMVIPVSMSCFMFLFMLNSQYGLINSVLRDYLRLPGLAKDWMNNTSYTLNVIIAVSVWQRIGFVALLFMSGIESISHSIIEAAIIDGANGWQRITRIVLPNLKETYMVVGMLETVTALKLFAQVVAMTGSNSPQQAGGPANSTTTMYVETYKTAFSNFDLGLGAAMGYIVTIIVVGLFMLNFLLTRTEKA
jgi:ABC-type sugar transport system permease subunit